MTQIFLGVLKKGPRWSPGESAETTADQRSHLAHLYELRSQGKLLMSGPIPDGEDYRGFVVLNVDSIEAAHALFSDDAHMLSGRLDFDPYPWLVATDVYEKLVASS
jgi:uncharacterized protein YciI